MLPRQKSSVILQLLKEGDTKPRAGQGGRPRVHPRCTHKQPSIPVLSADANLRCLRPASARMGTCAAPVGDAGCGAQPETKTALRAHATSVLGPRLLGCVLIIHMSDRSAVYVALSV